MTESDDDSQRHRHASTGTNREVPPQLIFEGPGYGLHSRDQAERRVTATLSLRPRPDVEWSPDRGHLLDDALNEIRETIGSWDIELSVSVQIPAPRDPHQRTTAAEPAAEPAPREAPAETPTPAPDEQPWTVMPLPKSNPAEDRPGRTLTLVGPEDRVGKALGAIDDIARLRNLQVHRSLDLDGGVAQGAVDVRRSGEVGQDS